MILKKTVKGGILLYAILMTSIFLLLVQVYLKQMEAYKSEFQAQRLHAQAHMMAMGPQLCRERQGCYCI